MYRIADKLRRPPSPDFRVVVVLPSRGNQGAATISAAERENVERVYVNAEVAIVDDRRLTIGSANLNGRGLPNDTEANVVTHDPQLARQTRLRLWSEHLSLPLEEVDRDPIEIIDDVWRPKARDQLERTK